MTPAKMFPVAALSTVATLALAAPASAADLTGDWRVNGKVDTFAYVLNCRFTQAGDRLSGVCTDMETSDPEHKPQGSHALTSGSVAGDRVTFAYKTHFLAFPFTVSYSGMLTGERITGSITVPGRRGTFTATRN